MPEFRLRSADERQCRPRSAARPWRLRWKLSFDCYGGGRGFGKTIVADPFEIEFSACRHNRKERDERVGGGRRKQIGAENLLAIVAAGKARDDVARDHLPFRRVTIAGLHDVRHQGLDLDDVAALGFLGHIDQGGRHQITSSVQAASVTTTSAPTDHNEPSESRAMAM